MTEDKTFINPIDPDSVTDSPHNLPYSHTRGGAVIRPEDQGKVKGKALKAMYQQTDRQLNQIKKQMETLAQQAEAIQRRIEISEKIYEAEIRFEPVMGEIYYLYERADGSWTISLIGPHEWKENQAPFYFVAQAQLMADHTWDLHYVQEVDVDLLQTRE